VAAQIAREPMSELNRRARRRPCPPFPVVVVLVLLFWTVLNRRRPWGCIFLRQAPPQRNSRRGCFPAAWPISEHGSDPWPTKAAQCPTGLWQGAPRLFPPKAFDGRLDLACLSAFSSFTKRRQEGQPGRPGRSANFSKSEFTRGRPRSCPGVQLFGAVCQHRAHPTARP